MLHVFYKLKIYSFQKNKTKNKNKNKNKKTNNKQKQKQTKKKTLLQSLPFLGSKMTVDPYPMHYNFGMIIKV